MQQVNMGETLCAQGTSARHHSFTTLLTTRSTGPAFTLTAAMCFFRALRVYPSPVELLMIYQQTVPEPVFKVSLFRGISTLGRTDGLDSSSSR